MGRLSNMVDVELTATTMGQNRATCSGSLGTLYEDSSQLIVGAHTSQLQHRAQI